MMATRDDVTVRIDTDLRAKARPEELDINLSRLFEDALRAEIDRLEARAATAADATEEIRLDLEDEEGRPYVGRLTGKLLGEGRDVQIFLTEDDRLIAYEEDKRRSTELEDDDQETLEDWFPRDFGVVVEVMHALGRTPEIDL